MEHHPTHLLFITQKIDQNDDDLGFVILWIKEFIKQGADVTVICLEKDNRAYPFPVYSLGKETGSSTFSYLFRFLKLIRALKYNRVFVHMNPEYFTLGGWYWFIFRIPSYLWYTHYTMHMHLRMAGWFAKRMFAATKQSLPQYEGSPKKIITGHGIDIDFWLPSGNLSENHADSRSLVAVHRLCRSKRLELAIKALTFLPQEYTLTIYGRDVEKDYVAELHALVVAEGQGNRVFFKGPVPMHALKQVYPLHRIMLNMASETIDKTMLEAMLFGVYPVTTKANSEAIGLPVSINTDEPKEIAEFILSKKWEQYSRQYLTDIVKARHSLPALIKKMNEYIISGK